MPSLTKQNLNWTQNHEVIALTKIKRTFLRTLQGGALGWPGPFTNQNLNRTQNHEVIALKKTKRTFLRTLQGGTLGAPSHEAKFKHDTTTKHLQREDGMGGLVRT